MPNMENVRQAFIALVSAKMFVEKVLADGEGKLRVSVFEQNVRHFLGDDNPVNSAIRSTLADSQRRHRLAILNNGVTIVTPEVTRMGNQLTIKNFQIVNGCQTSHVLFRNKDCLDDKTVIPVKVVEADQPAVIDEIVSATNSQTHVESIQLYAIKDEVRRIQQFFDAYPSAEDDKRLYFERRIREYASQDIPAVRIFDLQLLSKIYAAMFLDVPHLATGYAADMFEEKKESLFQKGDYEISYYAAAFTYYRLNLLLSNKLIDREFGVAKWHLMMVLKYQVAGTPPHPNARKEWEKYCQKILDVVWQPAKDAAQPFREACKFLKKNGSIARENLKRKAFTDICLNALQRKA